MIDIENREHEPTIKELSNYVKNPLFVQLYQLMDDEYQAKQSIEYSGDKVLLGWNVKFKKAGRTLCTVYPRSKHFHMLLVVGQKEKEQVEELLPSFSEQFQNIYKNTPEGMGQRWMLMDFYSDCGAYQDALKVIKIRRAAN